MVWLWSVVFKHGEKQACLLVMTQQCHIPVPHLLICDMLCENRTCRGINKNAVYPKIGGKRKFMDLLIMNSPVSLGIVLSIR